MAKRTRGSTSRPGQRRPIQRPAARPAGRTSQPGASVALAASVEPRPDELTAAEEARAAQLEAAIVAEERQAEGAKRRARAARSADPETVRSATTLSVSAAEEYAYVARDIKRIAILGGSLIVVLLILWALSYVAGVGIL